MSDMEPGGGELRGWARQLKQASRGGLIGRNCPLSFSIHHANAPLSLHPRRLLFFVRDCPHLRHERQEDLKGVRGAAWMSRVTRHEVSSRNLATDFRNITFRPRHSASEHLTRVRVLLEV